MKKYIPVMQFHSGNVGVLRPHDSEEACVNAIKDYIRNHPNKVKATTYMTREVEGDLDLMQVFGHPKSRDLMQDKKFMKELEQ